ncbi:MAG TPA: hypothetical protein VKA68_09915 [bacterium]|nr:hypothetical protein [bacterium]
MRGRITTLLALGLLCVSVPGHPAGQSTKDTTFIAGIDSALQEFEAQARSVTAIHPILSTRPPIAFAHQDRLYLFDHDSSHQSYRFVRTVPPPFPLPEGICASFPLSAYDNRPTSIVTPDILDSQSGYATLLHEFVHCEQARTVKQTLKSGLKVYKDARANQQYSWELNHPSPYDDSQFVRDYTDLLTALRKKDAHQIRRIRNRLYEHLDRVDYEYMLWQEWKEGFARYLENKVRRAWDLDGHTGKTGPPFTRVTVYTGGVRFIEFLTGQDPSLETAPERLFHTMHDYGR